MTALPRIPKQHVYRKSDPLSLVIKEGCFPQTTEDLDEFADPNKSPTYQVCGETEDRPYQADHDGGKFMDDPNSEEDFKDDNHKRTEEWDSCDTHPHYFFLFGRAERLTRGDGYSLRCQIVEPDSASKADVVLFHRWFFLRALLLF